ncbi:fructose-bisphosphate aldolase, class II [Anaerovirgula multivorans]|uniref:Fructose-bisphosphate aldolase, class II n=1 Tax=Anaerovirgula multivorans TaxID=312168 RepID=A0A239ARP6_9FIRM|nr:class II fructose-bisphosphate aldolase [Anaerovirgula multivorans]SNR98021.1 fructose-bisphosphate aldolase, class II [Anaerovirgula multivorans]
MLVNLKETLKGIKEKKCAVAGFNVFGYEDASAVIKAAEALKAPVILMTNKVAVAHMPIEYYGLLFTAMAKDAKVPVCIHLDHATDIDLVKRAIDSGFTSVMYDGSQLSIEENIKNTKKVIALAHPLNVSVEAEIGAVGYSGVEGYKEVYTEPEEAKHFAEATGVDALAVAIGTLHRMETQGAKIQFDRLKAIQGVTDVPLVIHGSTGITDEDLSKLTNYHVAKVNIGTALRMMFGKTLREEILNNPNEFDRIPLFKKPMIKVEEEAKKKMQLLGF